MFGSGKRDQTPTTAFKAQRFLLKRARCGKIFPKKKNADSMRQQLAEFNVLSSASEAAKLQCIQRTRDH